VNLLPIPNSPIAFKVNGPTWLRKLEVPPKEGQFVYPAIKLPKAL